MVAVEEAREDKSVSQEIIKGEGGYPMDFYSVSVALPIQLFVTTIQKRLNVITIHHCLPPGRFTRALDTQTWNGTTSPTDTDCWSCISCIHCLPG